MPTEQEARFRERQAAAEACNWTVTQRNPAPNAFITWLDERYPTEAAKPTLGGVDVPVPPQCDHGGFVGFYPEPTPESVAAFNERQLDLRRAYLMGYAEVLPEHRAEGVEKAARRFPLKRLVPPPSKDFSMPEGVTMQRTDLGDGRVGVYFSSGVGWMDRDDLLAALALLDAVPRVEDVPPEEET